MNLGRISFRTNENERQLLTRLNQRFKCKTPTQLMHRLFMEIDKYGNMEGQPSQVTEVYGDPVGLSGQPDSIVSLTPEQELDRMFPGLGLPQSFEMQRDNPKPEEIYHPPDPIESLTDQCRRIKALYNAWNEIRPKGWRQ